MDSRQDDYELRNSDEPCDLEPTLNQSLQGSGRLDDTIKAGPNMSGQASERPGANAAPSEFPSIVNYEFKRRLGEGGFGVVYLAWDRVNKRDVAVKVVKLRGVGLSGSSGSGQAIPELNEAWRLAEMSHSHIVKVLHAGEVSKSEIYITTEFVNGQTLRDWRRAGHGSLTKKLEILACVARALEHAHRNGIYHRDIKPENIMLDQAEKPYLMDFGLALDESDYSANPTGLTGTIAYMSPEQAGGLGRMIDGRSDIFSLGVVMYELITGRLPFRGESKLAILTEIINSQPVPMRQYADMQQAIETICMKCLEKRPENRFQTAGDLAEELEKLQSGVMRQTLRPVVSSRGFALAGLLLILMAGLVSSLFPFNGKKHSENIVGDASNHNSNNPEPELQPERQKKEDLPVARKKKKELDQDALAIFKSSEAKQSETAAVGGDPELLPKPKPKELKELLAQKTLAIFTAKCKKCHHDQQNNGLLADILDHDGLVNEKDRDEQPFVDLQSPLESSLWKQLQGETPKMPPRNEGPHLTADEQATVQAWLQAGAPAWKPVEREATRDVAGLEQLHEAILADLKKLPNKTERKNRRYFSLLHLWNNPEVTQESLRTTAIAVSKLVNSLSWSRNLVTPVFVGQTGYLLAIDLPDYGWEDDSHWLNIIRRDPYRLSFSGHKRIVELEKEINQLADNPLGDPLWVRADWFVVEASRPPLYHTLLELPATVGELEKMLGVDVNTDFLNNKLIRSGLLKSGVSNQNRVVDRHTSKYGYYWKSYDFGPRKARADIVTLPLGPDFKENPFKNVGFEADGGEMVFTLPNGLTAFFLAKSSGERLDTAPIDIVEDKLALASQGHVIINGISCMTCHSEGIKMFKDELLAAHVLKGEAREKIESIVKKQDDLTNELESDQQVFLKALKLAVEPFLQQPSDFDRRFLQETEPIAQVSQKYQSPLSVKTLQFELYAHADEQFAEKLRHNPRLNDRVMKQFSPEGRLKRERVDELESRDSGKSAYGFMARELDLGTPFSQTK